MHLKRGSFDRDHFVSCTSTPGGVDLAYLQTGISGVFFEF